MAEEHNDPLMKQADLLMHAMNDETEKWEVVKILTSLTRLLDTMPSSERKQDIEEKVISMFKAMKDAYSSV